MFYGLMTAVGGAATPGKVEGDEQATRRVSLQTVFLYGYRFSSCLLISIPASCPTSLSDRLLLEGVSQIHPFLPQVTFGQGFITAKKQKTKKTKQASRCLRFWKPLL